MPYLEPARNLPTRGGRWRLRQLRSHFDGSRHLCARVGAAWLAVLVCLVGTLPVSRSLARDQLDEGGAALPLKVLFVGNSYTLFNDLPATLEALAGTVSDGPRIETSVSARGGATLRQHWQRGHALQELERMQPTHVVLQDHSMTALVAPRRLEEFTRRFKEHIDRAGAQAILFATWARRSGHGVYTRHRSVRGPEDMQSRVDALYRHTADSLRARVAPVGSAWQRALQRWPQLRLHLKDGSHPTPRGSFLSACVLYGVLTGESPQRLGELPGEVSPEEQARLRTIAAEILTQDRE